MKIILFVSLSFLAFITKAQTNYSGSFALLPTFVYKTQNSVSNEFKERENGNLKLNQIIGARFDFSSPIIKSLMINLNFGITTDKMDFGIPYYRDHPKGNNIVYNHNFTIFYNNLHVSLSKEFQYFKQKLVLNFGTRLTARTSISNSRKDYNLNDAFFELKDTVYFSFNTFQPMLKGNLVFGFYSALEYKIYKNLSFLMSLNFEPRYQLGFDYSVLNIMSYEKDGIQYRQISEDRKTGNLYHFHYFQLGLGLSCRF